MRSPPAARRAAAYCGESHGSAAHGPIQNPRLSLLRPESLRRAHLQQDDRHESGSHPYVLTSSEQQAIASIGRGQYVLIRENASMVLQLCDLGDAVLETKQYAPAGYIFDNMAAWGYF